MKKDEKKENEVLINEEAFKALRNKKIVSNLLTISVIFMFMAYRSMQFKEKVSTYIFSFATIVSFCYAIYIKKKNNVNKNK